MSPRESEFYDLPEGGKVPRVTAILKAVFPFANLDWAAYMARDNTRRFAAEAYMAGHPEVDGRTMCLGLDVESFMNVLRRSQGDAPPHRLGQDSAEVGTAVHRYAEAVMRLRMGENVRVPVLPSQEVVDGRTVPSRHQNAVDSFHAWLDAHQVAPSSAETRLISREHGYAGTTDMLGHVDNVYTVVDFKTSKGIYVEYPLQLSAYAMAAVEMGLAEPPVDAAIVRFPKEAGDEFEVVTFPWPQLRDDLFPLFLGAIGVWKYRRWFAETYSYRKRR